MLKIEESDNCIQGFHRQKIPDKEIVNAINEAKQSGLKCVWVERLSLTQDTRVLLKMKGCTINDWNRQTQISW